MGTLKKHKTVVEALQYVVDHPRQSREATIECPAWELVARTLVDIANHPDPRVKASQARAIKAQKMLANRLVGRRRPGTHPAQQSSDSLTFVDLTGGAISE